MFWHVWFGFGILGNASVCFGMFWHVSVDVQVKCFGRFCYASVGSGMFRSALVSMVWFALVCFGMFS